MAEGQYYRLPVWQPIALPAADAKAGWTPRPERQRPTPAFRGQTSSRRWRRGLSAVVAVGARPCSGAIIVLVFALAQGLFWAGVVSTFTVGAKSWAARFAEARSGYGTLALRGIEVGAAVVIIAFGTLLLAGCNWAPRRQGSAGSPP